MTEEEWLTGTVPRVMLHELRPQASDRKLRLWACGFVREYARHHPYLVEAVRVAEKWADGEPPAELGELAQFYVCYPSAWEAANDGTADYVGVWADSSHKREYTQLLIDNLRCIFGNPFRPVAFDPRWRSETAVALAAGIYDGRHFDRLPILADSLEDAGCDSAELLTHLRGPGPHVRGCWAVDVVLDKQ